MFISHNLAGIVAYLEAELLLRRMAPKAEYVVRDVRRPGPEVTDVVLAPTSDSFLRGADSSST